MHRVRFQTVEEVKVISLQKLAASCGVWRQPATLQLFSKPSGHQARRVEGPGKMKAPGLQAVWKREALTIRGLFFCGAQARLALRPEAPTRLIARRML